MLGPDPGIFCVPNSSFVVELQAPSLGGGVAAEHCHKVMVKILPCWIFLSSSPLQTEIAKRLNVICAQLIPFLSQEVSVSAGHPCLIHCSCVSGFPLLPAPALFPAT